MSLDRILSIPKAPTHGLHKLDNWCGEGDRVFMFAFERDGALYCYDTGKPVIEYEGDKVLQAWPLTVADQPAADVIGVRRELLEEWATELIHAAQDGGTMSNQIEHLLVLHPKV